jgi:predicted nucleic acid-binding Zn ribbon protein
LLRMDSSKEDRLLRGAVGWQKKPRATTIGLGGQVQAYLRQRAKEFTKNASLLDVWTEVLPPALADHCRPESLASGTLRVEVDPGPWMHELRLMTRELLDYFQEHCPRNRVRKILLVPRRQQNQESQDERTDI